MVDERQNNLALYPGATRRQNVACDACRAKKVRCRRLTTTQRCEQCIAKDHECTSNYIDQLMNKPRRPRRFKSNDERVADLDDEEQQQQTAVPQPSRSPPQPVRHHSTPNLAQEASGSGTRRDDIGVHDAMAMMAWMTPPHATVFSRGSKDAGATQADLLRYLFSPTPVLHHEWRYSDVSSVDQAQAGASDMWDEDNGAIWEEQATSSHLNLWASGESGLEAAALDLLGSFFTVVHTRLPILDADRFVDSFRTPGADGRPALPHALLAVVLAFGAKFTEHAAFVGDREESFARDGRTRSRLVQLLAVRAREVVEVNKAFRIPSIENAQALIFLEALAAQSLSLKRDYRAAHLIISARHLQRVPNDHASVSAGTDDRTRILIALYIMSAFESAFFRLRPSSFETMVQQTVPLLMTSISIGDEAIWLTGARSAAGIYHKLCNELWRPQLSASGIPIGVLRDFIHEYSSWRDLYLGKLGLPVPWPESWGFEQIVKACSNDIMYHALWLVVEGAVRDFSIQEAPEGTVPGLFVLEVAQTSERLKSEALHAAMRIAMLSALATEQGILRIDPLVLYRPIFDAGMYLARQGREDCLGCVAGLRQYAGPYPQMLDCALEIQETFANAAPPQA